MSVAAWVAAMAIAAGSGLVSSRDEALGVPTFYWAAGEERVDLRALRLTPEEAARRYLVSHAELYGASASRWARAKVVGVHDLRDGTAVIVTFQQRIDGTRVFRDELKVVMTAKLELVALSGFLTPRVRKLGDFVLGPQAAVTSAFLRLAGAPLEASQVEALGLSEGDYARWLVPGTRRPVRTRPTWFPSAEGLTPAFFVELELAAEDRSFTFVISAVDGAVLYEHDLTVWHRYAAWADPVTLHPWPNPYGSAAMPNVAGAPTATPEPTKHPAELITLDHAGLSTGDPWLPAGAMQTRGNNVLAYADVRWPTGFTPGFDFEGSATTAGDFAWTYDFTVQPSMSPTSRTAGVVHAFYVTNFLHDWFYDDGFDEAGRNAQTSNHARGGAANDAMLVETMDWAGSNNANMTTPPDGTTPRMQLFLFGGTPARDSALDSSIIAHEWGHFITHRLIGDGDGLSSLQAGGLGEGWGDFHAALLLATADDVQVASNAQWQGAYPMASWSVQSWTASANYFGLRRYPLSADLAKNPLTFRHISHGQPLPTSAPVESNTQSNAQVHNTGEVWAVMLWECYVALLRDPRYTFDQARARMKRLLVASYKATPLTPTFVEARDAVLAVAAASDVQDLSALLQAFARRGLGRDAQAPPRDGQTNSPLVEDFSVGAAAQIVSIALSDDQQSCDMDGTLDVGELGRARVTVRNVGPSPLTGASLRLSGDGTVSFPAGATQVIPTLPSFDTTVVEFTVAVLPTLRGPRAATLTAEVLGTGASSRSRSDSFRINSDVRPASATVDDVEAPQTLWTATNDPTWGTSRTFAREDVTTTQRVWRAPSPPSVADLRLTSPRLSVGERGLRVTLKHRFDFDRFGADQLDGAVIELSTDDGQTWRDVGGALTPPYNGVLSDPGGQGTNPLKGRGAFVGQSPNYPTFVTAYLDLSAHPDQSLRLRFRLASDDGVQWPARGWELDELSFDGLTDTPFASVVGDPNSCTNRAPVAMVGPALELDEGTRVVLQGTATDADGDPTTLRWTQTSGPAGALIGDAFITPEVMVDTPVTLALVADDGRASSAPAELKITVRDVNRSPMASVPVGAQARSGERVTLRATVTDAEGDALTSEWRQVSGPTVTLDGADTTTVSLVAPAVTATAQVVLEFIARDAKSASSPARAVVTVLAPEPSPPTPEPMPEAPKGCGCSTVDAALLGALALVRARRRPRRPGSPPRRARSARPRSA